MRSYMPVDKMKNMKQDRRLDHNKESWWVERRNFPCEQVKTVCVRVINCM